MLEYQRAVIEEQEDGDDGESSTKIRQIFLLTVSDDISDTDRNDERPMGSHDINLVQSESHDQMNEGIACHP